MASEIRVDKINSLSGVGTVTLSPTGVDIAGITTAATLRATTGIVTSLTAVSSAKVGSGVTLSPDGDIFATGVTTSTTFVGALTGNVTGNATGLSGTPNISAGTIAGSTGTFTGDVDIADKIVHTGDTDTAIRFSGADTITAETGGSERVRIDSSGRMMIGNTNASTMFGGGDDLVVGNTSGAHGITIITSDSTVGRLLFSDSTSSAPAIYQGQINYNHNTDELDLRTYTGGSITFATGNAEKVRISSAGKMGVGTNNPTSHVDIHCGSDNTGLQITSTDAGAFASYYDNTGASSIGHSGTDLVLSADPAGSVGSSKISFQVDSNTVRATIDSTGDLTISDGDLVIGTAGHGIDFSAAPNVGGMQSELLDDYEEGTFTLTMTPVTSGSITLTTTLDSLRYTKIGNLVTIHGRVRIESVNSPQGGLNIGGLPYASITSSSNSQDGYQHFAVNTHGVNFDNNTVQIFGEMSPNQTGAGIFSMYDNANWAQLNSALLQGNQNEYFGFSFFYHTAT